jgi:hypothetical protein
VLRRHWLLRRHRRRHRECEGNECVISRHRDANTLLQTLEVQRSTHHVPRSTRHGFFVG